MAGMTTSEGSPRAALLHQAVQKGQTAAHMNPMSFVRPPLHGGPVNGVMTMAPSSLGHVQTNQKKAALMAIVMHLLSQKRGS